MMRSRAPCMLPHSTSARLASDALGVSRPTCRYIDWARVQDAKQRSARQSTSSGGDFMVTLEDEWMDRWIARARFGLARVGSLVRAGAQNACGGGRARPLQSLLEGGTTGW